MKAKRFNDYTDQELIALDNETINDAIRIEAIHQGVEPPITLSEALRKSEWRGYQKPLEAIEVFEIVTTTKYGIQEKSGIGFLDKQLAEKAIIGALSIEEETYGKDQGWHIRNSNLGIASRWVGITKQEQAWAKLEEYTQNKEAFDKVSDACINRLSEVRQADYNRRVMAEKKVEYLRLAGGNEEIAKGFWSKVERTEWPKE